MTLDALLDLLPWALPALVATLGLAAVLLAGASADAPAGDAGRVGPADGDGVRAAAPRESTATAAAEPGGTGRGDAEVALSHELVADGTWARPVADRKSVV